MVSIPQVLLKHCYFTGSTNQSSIGQTREIRVGVTARCDRPIAASSGALLEREKGYFHESRRIPLATEISMRQSRSSYRSQTSSPPSHTKISYFWNLQKPLKTSRQVERKLKNLTMLKAVEKGQGSSSSPSYSPLSPNLPLFVHSSQNGHLFQKIKMAAKQFSKTETAHVEYTSAEGFQVRALQMRK